MSNTPLVVDESKLTKEERAAKQAARQVLKDAKDAKKAAKDARLRAKAARQAISATRDPDKVVAAQERKAARKATLSQDPDVRTKELRSQVSGLVRLD